MMKNEEREVTMVNEGGVSTQVDDASSKHTRPRTLPSVISAGRSDREACVMLFTLLVPEPNVLLLPIQLISRRTRSK